MASGRRADVLQGHKAIDQTREPAIPAASHTGIVYAGPGQNEEASKVAGENVRRAKRRLSDLEQGQGFEILPPGVTNCPLDPRLTPH